MKRRTVLRTFIGVAITVLGAGACGQKGPLYSPEEKLEEVERKRDRKAQKTSQRRDPALAPIA